MEKQKKPHPTRIFKTPEELLKVWNEYKEDVEEQECKWQKVQYVGKDGERVSDPVKIPYTLEGLKRYCWDKEIGCIEQYFTNQDDCYHDFIGICSRIKNEIREHQIVGGINRVSLYITKQIKDTIQIIRFGW
jgi:hypothetical protein